MYSTCGWTRELYAIVLISLFLVTTFLLTKVSVLLVVLVILFMWVFQLKSLLMVTSRYFAASTDSSSWLCMKYLYLTELFERVIWIIWHLPGLNSNIPGSLPMLKRLQVGLKYLTILHVGDCQVYSSVISK